MKQTSAKRPTNISLDATLVSEAKALGLNLSQACERGLRSEIASARAAAWLTENADALDSSNAYVAAHGLPLAVHRQF